MRAARRMSANGPRSRQISWRQPADCVSLGRAKADSPSPRNGSEHPFFQIGSRNIPRILQTGDGEWQDHLNRMELCIAARARPFGGCATGTGAAFYAKKRLA